MPDTADSRVSGEGLVDAHILQELRSIVGERGLISSPEGLHTYECDGLTNFRVMPRAVLLPTSTEQVQAIVRLCHREKIPFVARGSGTGLSGGALPVENGLVISLARMNRILEVDFLNARVIVEPGVINLDVTGRVQPQEYFYAPDPSSNRSAASVATWRKTPAARIASSMDSRQRMCWVSKSSSPTARSSISAEKHSTRQGMTSRVFSWAPKARSASPQKSFCAS